MSHLGQEHRILNCIIQYGVFGTRPFDPLPFSFLLTVVSLEVIVLTLFVRLNQSYMTTQARNRPHLEFQVTLPSVK